MITIHTKKKIHTVPFRMILIGIWKGFHGAILLRDESLAVGLSCHKARLKTDTLCGKIFLLHNRGFEENWFCFSWFSVEPLKLCPWCSDNNSFLLLFYERYLS